MCRKLFAAKHLSQTKLDGIAHEYRPLFVGSYLRYSYIKISPYPNPPSPEKVSHTTGVYVPTLFEQWCGFFCVPQEPDKWKCCETGPMVIYGFSSLSEKTRKSKRLNMFLHRQHFLISYIKTLSVGLTWNWTNKKHAKILLKRFIRMVR